MTFKNSVRILSSNFSLCWKQLVWIVCASLVVIGFAFLVAMPVFDMLTENGFFVATKDCFESIYAAPKNAVSNFVNLIDMLVSLISSGASKLWPNYLGVCLVVLVLGSIVRCLGLFATSGVLGERMASNAQIAYTNRMFSKLGRAISYSVAYICISIPFYAVVLGLVVAYVKIAKTAILAIVLLPVFSVLLYLVFSMKVTLFACMLPEMIDGTRNPFKAFANGIKVQRKRFWRTFSNAICVVLSVVFANLFLGIFTLGAGLLVTIPASSVFLAAFGLVSHYAATGKSFYVSDLVVVNLK